MFEFEFQFQFQFHFNVQHPRQKHCPAESGRAMTPGYWVQGWNSVNGILARRRSGSKTVKRRKCSSAMAKFQFSFNRVKYPVVFEIE
jgi:hypothetical protein